MTRTTAVRTRTPAALSRRLAALLAAAALTAAGCAAEGGTAAAADAGVTEDALIVGGLLVETSTIGYSLADMETGALARFERANAEGGVHGRTIDYTGTQDDRLDPEESLAGARALAEKEQVLAAVPVASPAFNGADVFTDNGIPWFGWGTHQAFCRNDHGFGFNGCLQPEQGDRTQTWWGELMAEELGGAEGKTAWVQSTDSASSAAGMGPMAASFAAAGFEVIGQDAGIPADAAPADWTPYVNAVLGADGGDPPDVVVSVMTSGHNAGLYGALKRAGFEGAWTDGVSYDPDILAQPELAEALDGAYGSPQVQPFELAEEHPEVALMQEDLRSHTGDPDLEFSQPMAYGYWSADLFLAAAEAAGPDITRASLTETLNSGFTHEDPGFGTTEYPAGHRESNGCGALVRLEDGEFTPVQELTCTENTVYQGD
ncbi:ABC transporter substrate-binding protein [Nocardiopsis potens]|uniref:ABC transporter substrate-binding protein n=1 Tax=Nocardiopsis potens TaxID=1246458 RepID=UPI00034A4008|nr:ABC transporter substrate-binding protein [Nocardiopsis potens]